MVLAKECTMGKRAEAKAFHKKVDDINKKLERYDEKNQFLKYREGAIRFGLLKNNYTQKLLAKRLGLTESYISKLIKGERYCREFEFFVRFNLDVDYLSLD